MSRDYQDHTLDWQGLALSVRHCLNWLGMDTDHIEVRSPNRQPLPITETGYRSMFVAGSILAEWGGPLPYVQAALDAEAASPAWLAAQAGRRQLTLF